MRKVLEEDRRKTREGFELIDVGADKVAALRTILNVQAPLLVRWNDWEYASEIQELRALYEKGKRSQWNATDDIDWSLPVSKNEWLGPPECSLLSFLVRERGGTEAAQKEAMFDEIGYMLSTLLHGEQAALQIGGQLTTLCPTTDEKLYAANQTNDEARHVEVMARFLGEKMGTIHPIGPVVKVVLDELLASETYCKKALGMQTLFEGMAMGIMDRIRSLVSNPLLLDMLRRIQIDEARHAAFGVLAMRRLLRNLDQTEKNELEDWCLCLLEGINADQSLPMLRLFGPKYGIDPEEMVEFLQFLDLWKRGSSIPYMHTVIPNLLRLGLITHRTEHRYRELRMLTDRAAESAS